MESEKIIADLKQKILELETEGNILRERLDKYILKDKTYYEKNKEKCKIRVKKYQEENNYKTTNKATPEKRAEYARRAYLKRKEKLKNEIEKIKEIK